MRIISGLVQGTQAWHDYRAKHFNASDAPAMLGVSKYKSRAQLVKERATGIAQEVDDATQRRFNDGHRFEALARPLAEKIIGEELSPVTGSDGKYSASFDGITFSGDAIFEHKTLNDALREAEFGEDGYYLPEEYRAQMEHQLMVSGANKCLFMASKFDDSDKLIEERHCWYLPDEKLRQRIIAGWEQFEKDVAAYVPTKEEEKPSAEVITALPSVFVQATGMVSASNLDEFKAAATSFIANIRTELVTDQHFADAEATVKFCKDAEGNIEQVKKNITAQMSTVDEALRALDHIAAQLRDKRLMLDKLVKSEKEARKLSIVSKAGHDFIAYVEQLESETKPIQLDVARPDFAGAIKGLKSLSSMQEKVDTALRDGKFAADQTAKNVRSNRDWFTSTFSKEDALMMNLDLQALFNSDRTSLEAIAKQRYAECKQAQAEKLESERERIRQEEEAKAQAAAMEKMRVEREAERAKEQAEAAAKLAAETERIRVEEEAKARATVEAENAINKLRSGSEGVGILKIDSDAPTSPHGVGSEAHKDAQQTLNEQTSASVSMLAAVSMFAEKNDQSASVAGLRHPRHPGDKELIEAIQERFHTSYGTACDWVLETAERMKAAA